MGKATHADWEKTRVERDANAALIADSVVRGETPWAPTVKRYIDASAEMQRIADELDAKAGA